MRAGRSKPRSISEAGNSVAELPGVVVQYYM